MKPRISMVTLGVSDLARAVEFYQTGVGLPNMESPPEVAFFNLDGSWLGLFDRKSLADEAMISPEGSGYSGFNIAHNVASEAEVDEVMDQASAAGASITKPAEKTSWGGYSGYFKDLDGHLWEVAHNPHFWVGPEDK